MAAWSPYTERAVAFVKRNPGCSKFELATALRFGRVHPSKLYYLVNTQLRIGSIVGVLSRGRYYLYVPEDAPKDFRDTALTKQKK